MTDVIDTLEAADRLNIDESRVRQLISAGRLPAKKLSGVWVIDPADLDKVRERKPGRPRGKGDVLHGTE